MDFSRFPLLLITAALLIGGVMENEIGSGNQALLASGLLCLGSWLTIEVQTWHQRLRLAWESKVRKEWVASDALPEVFDAIELRSRSRADEADDGSPPETGRSGL